MHTVICHEDCLIKGDMKTRQAIEKVETDTSWRCTVERWEAIRWESMMEHRKFIFLSSFFFFLVSYFFPIMDVHRVFEVSVLRDTQNLVRYSKTCQILFRLWILCFNWTCLESLLRSLPTSVIMSCFDCVYLIDSTFAHSWALNEFHISIFNGRQS